MSGVVGLYPSIRHDVGLVALRKTLDDRVNKDIDTVELIRITT